MIKNSSVYTSFGSFTLFDSGFLEYFFMGKNSLPALKTFHLTVKPPGIDSSDGT